MRMAPPVVRAGAPAAALAAIADIRDGGLVDGLDWSAAAPDAGLVLDESGIALVGRDGVLDPLGPGTSPRIPPTSGEDVILAFLDRAVRLERLNAALAAAEGGRRGLTLPGAGLKVSARLLPAARDGGTCAEPQGAGAALKDRDAVGDCDQVWLTLENGSRTAQDVTVLYVDRDMGIAAIWPQAGLSNRIAFGARVEVGMRIETAGGGGLERILVIAVPARDGAPRSVLTGLADAAAERDAGAAAPTEAWLMAAADPEATPRAWPRGQRTEPVSVTRFRLQLKNGDDNP
jgi:hypothetical protein